MCAVRYRTWIGPNGECEEGILPLSNSNAEAPETERHDAGYAYEVPHWTKAFGGQITLHESFDKQL